MKKNTNSRTSLAQARDHRLGKKGSFAQAVGPRLGETANRKHSRVREFSIGRDFLA